MHLAKLALQTGRPESPSSPDSATEQLPGARLAGPADGATSRSGALFLAPRSSLAPVGGGGKKKESEGEAETSFSKNYTRNKNKNGAKRRSNTRRPAMPAWPPRGKRRELAKTDAIYSF